MSIGTDCPTGCGRTAAAGHMACRPCWAKVPKDLQKKVYATWRAWRKDFGDADLAAEYRNARENALAAIA